MCTHVLSSSSLIPTWSIRPSTLPSRMRLMRSSSTSSFSTFNCCDKKKSLKEPRLHGARMYLSQERQLKTSVWSDEVDQVLRPQASKKLSDIRLDEWVIHNRTAVIYRKCEIAAHVAVTKEYLARFSLQNEPLVVGKHQQGRSSL